MINFVARQLALRTAFTSLNAMPIQQASPRRVLPRKTVLSGKTGLSRKSALALLWTLWFCVACQPAPEQDTTDDPVVARVGTEVITAAELELAVQQSLGEFAAAQLGAEGRQKVLQSLVIRKLISQAQAKTMDAEQLQALELSVKAYREEQLTKAYLSTEVAVEPVTDAMVQAYYDANLADFGARDFANYQMLRIDVGDNAELKNKALSILEAATAQADWQKLAAQAEQNGVVVQFLTGISSEFSLLPDYKNVIDALAPQQVSAIQDGAGRVFRIRVLDRIQTPAKPLAEVAADIRKSLAPLQMKKAIQQASQQLKMHTEVEIYALPEEK